ncbi:hypothetical protein ADU59_01620 (plasmid) [Pararhizobium polonicum]|uniref:Uncharacterized protein n=1 Tax=Pararhizobium polonicum TaxID=1612624 RepID=A0A1C7P7Z6_9HYPH|nr:hypothetical protein [Pararhizobium polonicum]OBZ97300.1 hypothetical protein ADU59_01620 [Pararhizobium polonicum]
MIRARLAWAAFKNMMRAAARDPIWAFVNLIGMPFRIWKPLLQTFFILAQSARSCDFGQLEEPCGNIACRIDPRRACS